MPRVRRSKSRFTPSHAKNLVGVAKVIGPVVLPVVTPYLMKAAGAARDGLDRYRARKLGIDVADLPEFTGRGGALHVRIVGADQSLAELESAESTSADDRAYATRARDTLAKLAAAVRAAERMPTARRKAAQKSVGQVLDPIERELLRRLGVSGDRA
jgi:hypothetical protein